jgi:hypothetical protein
LDRALDSGELSMNPQVVGSMRSDQAFHPAKRFSLKARAVLSFGKEQTVAAVCDGEKGGRQITSEPID